MILGGVVINKFIAKSSDIMSVKIPAIKKPHPYPSPSQGEGI